MSRGWGERLHRETGRHQSTPFPASRLAPSLSPIKSIMSAAQTPPSKGVPAEGSPVAVLLVDDDPKNLLALESILEDGSFKLKKAQTGNQALLALMSEEFAAIVLDVQMPD